MRGLFTKIFLCFWLAQSLTFVISTVLILQRHFIRPDMTMEAFNATLEAEGSVAANAFEQSGCAGLAAYGEQLHQTIYLSDPSRSDAPRAVACSPEKSAGFAPALQKATASSDLQSAQLGAANAWTKGVVSASGKQYVFLLVRPAKQHQESWLRDIWHFSFPQLPVGIVVFGASTFFLVLMVTRPIAKLRGAARDLANGQLSARVLQDGRSGGLFGGDEIQALVHDFNYMAARLESLMGAQKLLLRDVSHELRTPLTRLCVTLELAREDAPASMMDHLARIEREAGCVTELIEQLLRLSSMESADTLVHPELFNVSSLVQDIVPNADFEARQRACSVRLEDECDCAVEGLPGMLYQAIENVVRNAIRYTREGSAVRLSLRCEAQDGRSMVVLDVIDEGPGIPESEIKNVFLPFYRVDGARQRNTGGFGVGLAIAERAVRLHHGEITARNRESGGLIVSIRVPCKQPHVAQDSRAVLTGASRGGVSVPQ